jgi:hypothetical protein
MVEPNLVGVLMMIRGERGSRTYQELKRITSRLLIEPTLRISEFGGTASVSIVVRA